MKDLERSSEETIMNTRTKPSMQWNKNTKTADIRKTLLISLLTEIDTEQRVN